MRGQRFFYILLVLIIYFIGNTCASNKPVLYNDGKPLTITEYEKIAQREYDNDHCEYAIEAYRAIIENYPENVKAQAWAHYEIGFCYYVLKEYDNAEKYFRRVINEFQDPAARKLTEKMIAKIETERAGKKK